MKTGFPSRRSVVMGFRGAVATSQSLAALAGLRMLLQGGNAADAAVAAAATLNVVEPMSTGMGGDAFALIYWAADRRVYGLNASGRAPYAANPEALRRRGFSQMPERGILPVTVPGAVAGWADLVARFGKLGLDQALQPAIEYAESGFPVTEIIGRQWEAMRGLSERFPDAARLYLPGGHAPHPGQRFVSPHLARSLRLVAKDGPDAFYRGPIARAIVRASDLHGGLLTMQDLADHTSTWVTPIHTDYRGYRVYECPPNGQGIAALIALNILSGYDVGALGFDSVDSLHLKMEAVKLGMTDARRYVADPEFAEVPVEEMLSSDYANAQRARINMAQAISEPQPGRLPSSPDTVYLCTADAEGNAVSFINSLYMGFGSGIVAPDTGIVLQNRGNLFLLDPEHPNCIAPHKRPYHTIIPCMVTSDDALAICFGVMGGFMQPQGHVQVLCNILDHGMNPQQAIDAPRFCHHGGDAFGIQSWFREATYAALRERGHALTVTSGVGYGGAQIIMVDPESGALQCGSDPYKDGCAIAL